MANILKFQKETIYAQDVLSAMRHTEEETYKIRDYLNVLVHSGKITLREDLMENTIYRIKMAGKFNYHPITMNLVIFSIFIYFCIDWFYQVIEFCNFNRTIANTAMAYLDKYIGTKEGALSLIDRREYQLSAMCCFELAVKINEPHQLDLKMLSDQSHGVYSQLEFQRKEMDILTALRWRMYPPTASCFANYYLGLLPQNTPSVLKEQIKYASMFQIENSIKHYSFLSYRPSEVALASVLNAISIIRSSRFSLGESFHENIVCIDGLNPTDDRIYEIRRMLKKLMEVSFSYLRVIDHANAISNTPNIQTTQGDSIFSAISDCVLRILSLMIILVLGITLVRK